MKSAVQFTDIAAVIKRFIITALLRQTVRRGNRGKSDLHGTVFHQIFLDRIRIRQRIFHRILQMGNGFIAARFVNRLLFFVFLSRLGFRRDALPAGQHTGKIDRRCQRRISFYTLLLTVTVKRIVRIIRAALAVGEPRKMRLGQINRIVCHSVFDHKGFDRSHAGIDGAGAAVLLLDRGHGTFVPEIKFCRQFRFIVRRKRRNCHAGAAERTAQHTRRKHAQNRFVFHVVPSPVFDKLSPSKLYGAFFFIIA